MHKKIFLIIIGFILSIQISYGQNSKKQYTIIRTETRPQIDGELNEALWNIIPSAMNFRQYDPYNGNNPSQRSKVKITYDDNAIYIGAMLYDNAADSIMRELSERDNPGATDYFGIAIDPFNDAQTAYGFIVTASGVQMDMKITTGGHDDPSWDAVWKSEARIVDNGWIVEIQIPYSAIRFSTKDVQNWGFNIFRNIERHKELNTWNFISKENDDMLQQQGELVGLKNIKSPLRLSVMPYASAYLENYSEDQSWGHAIKGGLDLKYGINESFTLDMMLIPDFGQVESDDHELNLGPFETYYGEKRAFFTEGTEFFSKARIFYSRRIGSTPAKYWDVYANLSENEEVTHNDSETQLINATKISGKTNTGLGIGFLNAMTTATYAEITDMLTLEKRIEQTQSFTNYNLFSVTQSLKNSSYISLINTNVARFDENYVANVTGAETRLVDNSNQYEVSAKGAFDQKKEAELEENGYYYRAEFAKISGNFRFEVSQNTESDTYNPNDLGFIRNNNEFSQSAEMEYNIYTPFWKIIRLNNSIRVNYAQLYKPRVYSYSYLAARSSVTFSNYISTGLFAFIRPIDNHDYDEARIDGRYLLRPARHMLNTWISTDYRKKVALDIRGEYLLGTAYGQAGYELSISPRLRLSDKFTIIYNFNYDHLQNDLGYVDNSVDESIIYFGKRNISTYENRLNFSYIFSNKFSLNLRMRHYWSYVEYDEFYTLNMDGTLDDRTSYSENHDLSYNAFNVDMVFRWLFAPGSEFVAVWKNSIYSDSDVINYNFSDNLSNTWQSDQINSFSLKALYYLDYQSIKRSKR